MKRLLLYLLIPLVLVGQQRAPRVAGRQRPGASQEAPPAPTRPEDRCTVEGQVVNATTGEPLKKAAITLRRVDSATGAAGVTRTYRAPSDASGKFSISNIEPGKYRLSATRTGFVDADYGSRDFLQAGTTFSLNARQRMGDVLFRMTPHGVITGRIVDEDGEPMAFLQVQAMRYRYSQGGKQLVSYESASTNDIGEYRVFGLPPGRYYVCVSTRRSYLSDRAPRAATQPPVEEEYVPTYFPGTTDLAAATPLDVGPGAQLRGADLSLSRRRTVQVKGHVTDASGSDGRRRSVYLIPRGLAGSPSTNRSSIIDANGNFEIRGVASGAYTLVAAIQSRGGSLTARLPVEVGNSDVENVNITIHPALNLSGQVRLEGQTPANFSTMLVNLRPRDPNGLLFGSGTVTAKVREDGSFSLQGVNPDNYSVALSGMPDGFYVKSVFTGGQDVLISGLDLSRGAAGAIDIALASNAGLVTGVVQNGQQQPAAGATVVLIPLEKERRDQAPYKTAVTDAAGGFSVKNLSPGQYKVYAWGEVESGAYMDPDFVKPVEDRGEALTIREGSQESVQLKLIH